MCDAVQDQRYEIDGIEVSNFVLPLYFTEGTEEGSRNDFLGREEDEPLPSFGVAPGGYIGFFDPEIQQHDQHFAKRGRSRERWRARSRAGWTRRAKRREWEISPEPILRRMLQTNPDEPLPGPWFEGFSIDVRPGRGEDAFDLLDRAARAVLGRGWTRRWRAYQPTDPPDGLACTRYELVPREKAISVGEAWNHAYALRKQRGLVDVEPDFVFFRADSSALLELPPRRRWSLFGGGHLPQTANCEWSLKQIKATEAWQLSKGESVTIGHPDTGFLPHPEVWPGEGSGPIDTVQQYDFVADEDDAHAEPEEDDFLPSGPNHGTATASVIVSTRGPAEGGADAGYVSGVAPAATLVPLRVGNSPVHFSMRRVRKAVEYATTMGFDVLSMSLGGPFPSRHLHAAIQEARRNGVILIVAAGNYIPFKPVLWPARYPEVVAVAACNADAKPWCGSSRGETIDITAPGESVWRALVDPDEPPARRDKVERSAGTSYAAANVAGVCALWLAHHGREALWNKYDEYLADAFRYVLARTAQKSEHLGEDDFGPGIVDADAALRAPLPSRERVVQWVSGLRARRGRGRSSAEQALSTFAALFPHLDATALRQGLEGVLDTDAAGVRRQLREVGDELAFRFAVDPSLSRQFSARCNQSGLVRARTAKASAWRRATFADLRGRLQRDASEALSALLE
jgi:thermitase